MARELLTVGMSPDALPSAALVALTGVHLSFGGGGNLELKVLDGIDLVISRGEFLAVLGPSGCGKSTLLRLVAGLLPPTAGSMSWSEGLIERRPSRMAMNFQKPVLLPWLSLEQNALLPFNLAKSEFDKGMAEAKERLERLLKLTGLEPFRHYLPHELSGGMQMRAALVRTLIVQPDLVLMDEPFAAIDELTREGLGRDFRSIIASSDAATIFVTHSIQEAAFLADRVVILSPRPSKILADLAVPLPGGERDISQRRNDVYLDFCDGLREIIANG